MSQLNPVLIAYDDYIQAIRHVRNSGGFTTNVGYVGHAETQRILDTLANVDPKDPNAVEVLTKHADFGLNLFTIVPVKYTMCGFKRSKNSSGTCILESNHTDDCKYFHHLDRFRLPSKGYETFIMGRTHKLVWFQGKPISVPTPGVELFGHPAHGAYLRNSYASVRKEFNWPSVYPEKDLDTPEQLSFETVSNEQVVYWVPISLNTYGKGDLRGLFKRMVGRIDNVDFAKHMNIIKNIDIDRKAQAKTNG